MTIESAIKQPTFKDAFERANINILYTANWMNSQIHAELKPFDLSAQQFNILRILRGQKGKPAPLKLLTERMMDKMSNTSRLVDKMLAKQLLIREICPDNRRQVEISITEQGLKICNEISAILDKNRTLNSTITEKEANELSRILDKMRND